MSIIKELVQAFLSEKPAAQKMDMKDMQVLDGSDPKNLSPCQLTEEGKRVVAERQKAAGLSPDY